MDFTDNKISEHSIQKSNFKVFTVSKKYTKFMLTLKFCFLLVSILCLAIYLRTYCFIEYERKSFEHKYILILCISLIFYNNPLYYLAI